jgi:AcrR family transcriptional regulator
MLMFVNCPVEEAGARMAERSGTETPRRDVLLERAGHLFAARGFRGVSVHEIGAAAGISGPGIYRHFASKEALLGAVLVSISEQLLAGGRLRSDAASDPASALEALVAFHTDFALDHPELITVQDREFAHLTDDDRRRVRRLQRSYVEIWVEALGASSPGLAGDAARTAVHATFGLLNSTPHSTPHSASPSSVRPALDRPATAALLRRLALGALRAADEL